MRTAAPRAEPLPSAITISHVVYALHAAAIVLGIAGTATVVGSFVGSLPSIVAVILNYLKRRDARGTWVDQRRAPRSSAAASPASTSRWA